MDLRGKTFWEMEKESISYIRKNESVWSGMAVIARNVFALEQNEQELDLAYKAQDANDPGGHVDQKNMKLNEFYRKIYKLACKLSYYAKNVSDKVLLDDVAIAESVLMRLPEKEALIKCNTIINRGNEYLDRTADYSINAAELDSLSEELTELEKMMPAIGLITNDRKSATRSIKEVISEGHIELDKLDDAFEGIIDDNRFIDGWFAVRKIKGRRKPKEKDKKMPPTE